MLDVELPSSFLNLGDDDDDDDSEDYGNYGEEYTHLLSRLFLKR